MRKDYKVIIDNETVNKLCELLPEGFDVYEGVLQDNYIFWDTSTIKIGRCKPRKYIMVRAFYKNCWSSGLELIATDSLKKVKEFEAMLREWEEEREQENIAYEEKMKMEALS